MTCSSYLCYASIMNAFPEYADELAHMLKQDQAEKRELGRIYFSTDQITLEQTRAKLRHATDHRAKRVLEILAAIGEPSISNIGADGAQAMSVLAIHAGADEARQVLAAFEALYRRNKHDCFYRVIPSMTDLVLLTDRKPQRFGTQWFFDAHKQPFLPTVEDFENFDRLNERRAEYDIEPLRWPKSLAIPETDQPWLARPLSSLTMRPPTAEEYKTNLG